MRLVVATVGLQSRGGVHSYLEALLPELTALDHETYVLAPTFGLPEVIRERGAIPCSSAAEVPGPVDGIIALVDHPALEARAAFPSAPMVFVSHGWFYAQDVPPMEAAPCAVVAMSDRVEARLSQSEVVRSGVPLVRLTQPAEFRSPPLANTLPELPRSAVVVAHRFETRREPLLAGFAERGIDVRVLGGENQDDQALDAVLSADIVVGIGRVVVEGMAAARACLVLGEFGGGRWLSAETYRALEAGAFFCCGDCVPQSEIAELLDGYNPDLGRVGGELARTHHSASLHAAAILEHLTAARPPAGMAAPDELRSEATARYRRYESRITTRNSSWWAADERHALLEKVEMLERDVSRMIDTNDGMIDTNDGLRVEVDGLRSEVVRVQGQLESVYRSAYWRMTAPLRSLVSFVRRFRSPR